LVNAHCLSPGLSYMEAKIGCKYKGHWLFSWSLEGSFRHCHFQLIHRSSIEYSFCSYCQSCRTQVVAWISHHISQLQWPHTT
jgi:hypothetical protein